jgi:hypothetical protein
VTKFAISPVIAAAALKAQAAQRESQGRSLPLPASSEGGGHRHDVHVVSPEAIERIDPDARVEIWPVSEALPPAPGGLRAAIARHHRLNDALYFEDASVDDVVGLRFAIDGTVLLYVRR